MMFRKIVYTLAFLHLALIAVVILRGGDAFYKIPFLERPLAFLTSVNYSAWRFGFFTPDVGKSTEVEITLYGSDSSDLHYSTLRDFDFFTSSQESANRFYGFKVHMAKDTLFQDLSARSACTRMLNLHREYPGITFAMRGILYPRMQGFRQDSAIKQHEYYSISFELN